MKLFFFTTVSLGYLFCVLAANDKVQLKSISVDNKDMLAAFQNFKNNYGFSSLGSSNPNGYEGVLSVSFGKILSAKSGFLEGTPKYNVNFELVESEYLNSGGCLSIPVYKLINCQVNLLDQDSLDFSCKKNLTQIEGTYGEDENNGFNPLGC